MNNKLLLKFTIITAFLLIGSIGAVQAQDSQSVGVKVGDSFNFEVTQNDFTQSASYLSDLLSSVNTSQLSSDYNMSSSFNVSTIMQSFNVSQIPAQGTVFGVTVVQLPSTPLSFDSFNSSDNLTGALNVTDGSTTKTVTTGFLLGTPVASTNWTFWKTALYKLQTTDSSANPQVTVGAYPGTTTFNATVDVTFQLPSSLTSNSTYTFKSVKVALAASYDATTGVLNSESVALTLQGTIPVTNTFAIARTTKPLTTTNSVTSSTPGFEAIMLLAALPVVAIYYKRKN